MEWFLHLCKVKQGMIGIGFFDAFAGDVKVFAFQFDADELAAQVYAGHASRAAAHEGIEDGVLRQ